MSENLSTVLRACIQPSQLTDIDAASNKESLTQCLRTYALIDQTAEAEKVISEELLTPFMNKVRNISALGNMETRVIRTEQYAYICIVFQHIDYHSSGPLCSSAAKQTH